MSGIFLGIQEVYLKVTWSFILPMLQKQECRSIQKCPKHWHLLILTMHALINGDDKNEPTMMTSSNGNIFRVTGHLCGEFTGPGEFPTQRPVTRNFDVYFDLRPNKRFSKQWWGWWFKTQSCLLWRHRNEWWHVVGLKKKPNSNEFSNKTNKHAHE